MSTLENEVIASKRQNEAHILLGIFAIATFFRLWNIHWGLPDILEEATPYTTSWKFWNWGKDGIDLNPHFFHYPALTFYIHFIVQGLHYLIGHIFGVYSSLDAFQKACQSNPTNFVILARMVTVTFDLGTIYITYLIGRQILNNTAGLFAGFLLAISPLHIRESHLVNVDIALTFFSALSLFFILQTYYKEEKKYFFLSGIGIGLASASKFTGAVLFVVLWGIQIVKTLSQGKGIRNIFRAELFFAGLTASLIFVLFNPYIILDYKNFLVDFSFEQQHMSYGHFGLDENITSGEYYFLDALPGSLGWVFFCAIAFSTAYLVFKKRIEVYVIFLRNCILDKRTLILYIVDVKNIRIPDHETNNAYRPASQIWR